MADISLTAAQIAAVFPDEATIFEGVAGATITAGQVVRFNTSGKLALADADAGSSAEIACGVALNGGGAGQAISVLKSGHVAGFTVSSMAYGAAAYLSDTAGALADAPSTTNAIRFGSIVPLSDATPTKVLFVDFDWSQSVKGHNRIFISAEQTGTGSAQNVAHGLGVIPAAVFIAPTDLTPATVGSYSVTEGTHTTTNVVVTVTTSKKFKVLAIAP